MKTITKKPQGKVEVLERHRTQKGFIFRPGLQIDYFAITRIKEDCGCGRPVTYFEFYDTKYGLLPTSKGKTI